MDTAELKGKIVWVTGGGSGIGLAGAVELAKAGAHVVISGRNEQTLATAEKVLRDSGSAEAVALDVADHKAVAKTAAGILKRHDHIDILVNSAGVNLPKRSFHAVSVEGWDQVVAINLSGMFYCCNAVLPGMRTRQDGLIINVSSWAGRYASGLTGPAYNATKRAVIALTESITIEECANGIRATSILPGEVATPIMEKRPIPPSKESVPACPSPKMSAEQYDLWRRCLRAPASMRSSSRPPGIASSSAGSRRRSAEQSAGYATLRQRRLDEHNAMPVTYQTIQVSPITATIGAEVSGVDLSQPVDAVSLAEIHRAWMEHLVLFFRDQNISIEQQKTFARYFGSLHTHPTAPGLHGDTDVFVVHVDSESRHQPGDSWHTDVSCDERPPLGSILRLFEVPPSGGDTLFVNMYAVYESLSHPMQDFLSTLSAVHSAGHAYAGRYDDNPRRDGAYPQASHPVVRTHPVTGRKGLYVNEGFTTRIENLSAAESVALLDFLYTRIREPDFQCRFGWRKNSIAMWDNRCTQHHALWDYYPATRSGYRITIAGDRPR